MGPELRAGDSARGRECPFFLCAQRNKTKFHSFSEAGAGCYLLNSDPFPHNSNGELRPLNGEPWRFRVRGQTAGRHRPHHRRLHQAEEGGGAELFGAVSVSRGEDGVVFGACHAPVLSLLRLRPFGGRVQLRAKNRKHYLPRGGADGGAEAGDSAAQGKLFDSRRSQRSAAARAVAPKCVATAFAREDCRATFGLERWRRACWRWRRRSCYRTPTAGWYRFRLRSRRIFRPTLGIPSRL